MWRGILVLIVGITAQTAHSQPVSPANLPPRMTVAERAEFYQRIAREESTATLEQLAREAATSPQGTAQREQLEVIVERYFSSTPRRRCASRASCVVRARRISWLYFTNVWRVTTRMQRCPL